MAEHVTKEQVIDWYRPYGQTDEPIPFETLVSDLRDMEAADVAPVRHAMWVPYHDSDFGWDEYGYKCSDCNYRVERDEFTFAENFCPLCGAKMDLED